MPQITNPQIRKFCILTFFLNCGPSANLRICNLLLFDPHRILFLDGLETLSCKLPVFRIRIRIRIHMFLSHPYPYPDPFVRGMDPDPSIILLLSSKNCKKNLACYCFVTSFDFLSLKNDVTAFSFTTAYTSIVGVSDMHMNRNRKSFYNGIRV